MYIDMDEYKAEIKKWNAEHMQQIPERASEYVMMNSHPFMINGYTSDGYHTFNELYAHRTALFSVLVNQFPSLAWKSKKHSDGTMFENMFVVGMATPVGNVSYHMNIDDWDLFICKALDKAPEWDGYTSKDVVERLRQMRDFDMNTFELQTIYERGKKQAEERKKCKETIILKLCEQYERKNHDYGNSADDTYDRFGIVSYLTRISDKLNRYQTLTQADAQVNDEKITDTVGDMFTYCCMALSKLSDNGDSATDIMKDLSTEETMFVPSMVWEMFGNLTAKEIASPDNTKVKDVLKEMAIFAIDELTDIEFERKNDNEEV